MIDKLRSLAIFSTVVDQGTFRAAALHLGLAPSRVSETVSDLEKSLGVTLLYRSTRQLSLTNEGRLLHESAQAMMATVENALDAVNPTSPTPQGALRITAPAFVAQTDLMEEFAAFAEAYPKIALSFDFSDAPRDLIGDGFDVGIRAGWLEDSELMTRNIGREDRLLVASPACLERYGVPKLPEDLEDREWVRFAMRPDTTLLIHEDGREVVVTGRSHVSVNSAQALFEFTVRGLGITALPYSMCQEKMEQGELVRLLPDWALVPLGFHAVWPDQSRRENLTMLFVRFLAGERTD